MKIVRETKLLLLLIMVLGLSACGDNYYSDDYLRNSDEKLCANTWVEEYTMENGDLCKHYLDFSMNYSGREKFDFYRSGETSSYKETSYNFSWNWIDASMENLEINYGGNDVIYFDNVWVREHNLSGKLDGTIVMFVDNAYYN